MATVTKRELVGRIAEQTQASRSLVRHIIQAFLDEIVSELSKNNRLEFRDFGVFETKIRAGRVAQNPRTLERLKIPTKRMVRFKMGRVLKQNLSKPSRQSAKVK